MEVGLTHRHSLTCNDDGGRSETITSVKLYSPIRSSFIKMKKYYESSGIAQNGMDTLGTQKLKENLVLIRENLSRLKKEKACKGVYNYELS